MPQSQWRTPTQLDSEVLRRFRTLWIERGSPSNHSLSIVIADGSGQTSLTTTITALAEHTVSQVLSDATQSVCRQITISINEGQPFSLSISRDPNSSYPGSDSTSISIPEHVAIDGVAKAIGDCRRHFPVYAAGAENLDAALGPVLGEFYRRREESVNNIEQALKSLVKQSVEVRGQLDRRIDVERSRLTEEMRSEEERMLAILKAREASLEQRTESLAIREEQLDDRTNTHARREIHKELKDKFTKRSEVFSLTPQAAERRKTVQGAYWVLLITTFLLAAINVWEAYKLFDVSTQPNWWLGTVAAKGIVSAFAFFGAVVFYIRWADSWSERHAAEEFKLKRLELDMDRASWLVETALEWKEEKGATIPPELVQQLSRNLFDDHNAISRVQHPAEDLAGAIFGAASTLKIALPGGEATFDRKSLKQIADSTREPRG